MRPSGVASTSARLWVRGGLLHECVGGFVGGPVHGGVEACAGIII